MMIHAFKKCHILIILCVVLMLAYYVVCCCQFRQLLSDETYIHETWYVGNIIYWLNVGLLRGTLVNLCSFCQMMIHAFKKYNILVILYVVLKLAYYIVCCCQFLQLLSEDDTNFQETSYVGNLLCCAHVCLSCSMVLSISAVSVRWWYKLSRNVICW